VPALLSRGVRAPRRLVDAALARRALNQAAEEARTLDDQIDLAFEFSSHGFSIKPMQVRSELRRLLELLAASPPRAVLEIGTAAGGTLFLLTRVAARDASVVSVDLPFGPFGSGYGLSRAFLYRGFPRAEQRLTLLRADSRDPATAQRVAGGLEGGGLDFLLIDGDHSYEGVRADWERYRPLVRPGGVVALHDIVPGPAGDVGDVPRFWSELRREHEVEEIVAAPDQRGFGLGIIRC
jgi:predicted O-methyltransferase YrrM